MFVQLIQNHYKTSNVIWKSLSTVNIKNIELQLQLHFWILPRPNCSNMKLYSWLSLKTNAPGKNTAKGREEVCSSEIKFYDFDSRIRTEKLPANNNARLGFTQH